jgi:NADH dehydrogenase
MWRTVYWWKLPGVVRKIRVGIAWALDLVIPPDSVQLRLTSSAGVTQAHYEAGENVFLQGDLGDALYIILEGTAEVILEAGGKQEVIATLGAGDYFGEQALLNNRTRAATVRCIRPMNVLALRKGDFSALTANLPELHDSFQRVMEQRMVAQRNVANRSEESSP